MCFCTGQHCRYECLRGDFDIKCGWYNHVIKIKSGKDGYWSNCSPDSCSLPNSTYLCQDMQETILNQTKEECDNQDSCSHSLDYWPLDTSCCVLNGINEMDCNGSMTCTSAIIWECITEGSINSDVPKIKWH